MFLIAFTRHQSSVESRRHPPILFKNMPLPKDPDKILEYREKLRIARKLQVGEKAPGYGHHPTEETKRKMRECKIGNKNPMFGKTGSMYNRHHTEETKNKLRILSLGNKYSLGKKRSQESIQKLKLNRKGKGRRFRELNPAWKGGVTDVKTLIRSSLKYQEWRQSVFIRDNFTCFKCHLCGGKLQAHHKKPFSILVDEAKKNLPLFNLYDAIMIYTPFWDIKNGITVCLRCHKLIKHKVNYSGKERIKYV